MARRTIEVRIRVCVVALMSIVLFLGVSASASASEAAGGPSVEQLTSYLKGADGLEAFGPSARGLWQEEIRAAEAPGPTVDALRSQEGGDVRALYLDGYISLTSHASGGSYSYRKGTSVRVSEHATDPDGYGNYRPVIMVYDNYTDEVVLGYVYNSCIGYVHDGYMDVPTGDLAVSTGRYVVNVVLWDDIYEYIEDYDYFNLNVYCAASAAITQASPNPAWAKTPVTFAGRGYCPEGHPIVAYQWRSSINGVIGSSASFTSYGLSAGAHTIYLKAKCSRGAWSPEVSRALTVKPCSVSTAIDRVAPSPSTVGDAVSFAGHGYCPAGHRIEAYRWRSSINGVLSTSPSFSTSSLSAGTHTIYLKTKCSAGYWSNEWSKTLTVNRRALSSATWSAIANQGYSGAPMTPTVTIRYGSATLLQDRDYTLAYADNVDRGTANVTATGIGDYTGAVTKTFKIGVPSTTLAGSDRYATGIAISKAAFPAGSDTVVVATARNFPDALSAAGLAGACDAPILLTPSTSMASGLAAEIARLGATKAYVIGGSGAVSEDVYAAVREALGGAEEATRLAGADRYATADEVAGEAIEILKRDGGRDWSGSAFMVVGTNYPDALVAGPVAFADGRVVLLTNSTLSTGTAAVLGDPELGVDDVTVVGGVLPGVKAAVEASYCPVVASVVGSNRYDTAARFADLVTTSGVAAWDGFGLATGLNYPDALAAAPLLGRQGSVLLLTPSTSLNAGVRSRLMAHKYDIDHLYYVGGSGAVSGAVKTAVFDALFY